MAKLNRQGNRSFGPEGEWSCERSVYALRRCARGSRPEVQEPPRPQACRTGSAWGRPKGAAGVVVANPTKKTWSINRHLPGFAKQVSNENNCFVYQPPCISSVASGRTSMQEFLPGVARPKNGKSSTILVQPLFVATNV